jgi:hypothetical protein
MMVKHYSIMEKDEWRRFVHHFHPQFGSHYIDLPSGQILVGYSFQQEASEDHFFSTAKGLHLPHAVWHGNDPIGPEVAEHVHHLFDGETTEEKKAAASKATTKDIAARASKIHPLLRMRAW